MHRRPTLTLTTLTLVLLGTGIAVAQQSGRLTLSDLDALIDDLMSENDAQQTQIDGLASGQTNQQSEIDSLSAGQTNQQSQIDALSSGQLLHTRVPYRRTDGALVAQDWADLTDGAIANPIDHTADGTQLVPQPGVTHRVWTGTATDGTFTDGKHCLNWNSGGSETGTYGRIVRSGSISCSSPSTRRPLLRRSPSGRRSSHSPGRARSRTSPATSVGRTTPAPG